MDFVSKLPKTISGYDIILVVFDRLTKFADNTLVIPIYEIQINLELKFVEGRVEIMDRRSNDSNRFGFP